PRPAYRQLASRPRRLSQSPARRRRSRSCRAGDIPWILRERSYIQLRGAVGAATGLERNGRRALRAFLGGNRRRRRAVGRGVHLVHLADEEEHRERDDDEVQDLVDEDAVVQRRRARGLGGGDRLEVPIRKVDEEVL